LQSPRLEYAAFVSTLDERIGRLLDALEATGQLDNTIIVFQSDHGFSTESRANFGGGSAGTLRGAKFSLFEAGIRVPAIISWPKKIPVSEARLQFAVSADWFPTILDLAEIEETGLNFDRKSLVPVLQDGSAPSPHDYYLWRWNEARAIRKGSWKLMYDTIDTSPLPGQGQAVPVAGPFLSNIDMDETERENLASVHPAIVAELIQLMED
jgi:arylsulfatase A-like enzyme